jgi:hypothetical protein
MFNPPNSVKSLRAYYKDKLTPPDAEKFEAEIIGESDRAFVILIASILEDSLAFSISKHLTFQPTEAQYDHVFRQNGPLGSFSFKIEVAYLFGFIDERMRSQFDDMREMRNACAHSKHPMDFGIPQLANVAKRIFHPVGLTEPHDHTRSGLRRGVYTEFLILYHTLMLEDREAAVALVRPVVQKQGVRFP